MKVHFAFDGDNKYSATKEYSKDIYMMDFKIDLYAAERKAEARTFFNRVITPFLDQSEDGRILESVFVHMIKDEEKKGQV